MTDRTAKVAHIEQMAKRMRKKALDVALMAGAKSTHLGGALSLMDITATLYGAVMNYKPEYPEWEDRDRFILSKGHGVLGYYPALVELGLISDEELMAFEKTGSFLLGHPVINREKGIEFSNGSLGMGIGLGIGVALAGKKRGKNYRVFVAVGDGECNEGSIWESAMSAAHLKLDNLTVIVDRNKLQQTGTNEQILNAGDIAQKWKAFGWHTVEIDGHNAGQLFDTLSTASQTDMPMAVIAHTTKGKGVSFAENNNEWHHNVLIQSQYDIAIKDIGFA